MQRKGHMCSKFVYCGNARVLTFQTSHLFASLSHEVDVILKAADSSKINIQGEMHGLGHIWEKVHHVWVDLLFLCQS